MEQSSIMQMIYNIAAGIYTVLLYMVGGENYSLVQLQRTIYSLHPKCNWGVLIELQRHLYKYIPNV